MSLDQLHLLPPSAQQAILDGLALAPPAGITPELVNPPNRNGLGLAVTTVCLVVATIALLLAAYAKLRCVKKAHVEDFFVFSGYGLTIGVCYCLYAISTGVGFYVHQWNVRVRDLAHMFYLVHVGSILYSVAIMIFKIAILLQWARLFVPRGHKGSFYWTCRTLILLNILLYVIIVVTICASCKPFRRLWDKTVPGTCAVSREAIDVATAVGNLISDLVILVLPQRVIWKLQLKMEKKIGIAFIFVAGVFALLSAGFRVDASSRFLRTEDKTYDITEVAFWALAELTCAILIFCVPSIPKIFKDSKLSTKLPQALVSWFSLSGGRSATRSPTPKWPGSRGKALPLDSLCDPSYGHHLPVQQQYDAEKAPSCPLERPPAAGWVRTTRVVVLDDSGNYTTNESAQFQSGWCQYDVSQHPQ
ncbi:hypothetical protein F4780DRAFT_788472 [Xylariomycetidae sp. FL0641]|nr:hypothetical protein F4780DRAFT_788472 [Xylariomycetidae sp. FL0641]